MIFADAGSTWSKVFDSDAGEVEILPTAELPKRDLRIDWGTGHVARGRSGHYENDLVALAKGALALVDAADFTIIDVGSRDTKYVSFVDRRPHKLDWSVGCAAATGATVEMLGRFYDVDFASLPDEEAFIPVTCATYGLERIMDLVARGGDARVGVSRFIHGITRNVWAFAGRPERLYLSGGFCRNPAFLRHLGRACDLRSLGRLVPLAGLWTFAAEQGLVPDGIPSPLR